MDHGEATTIVQHLLDSGQFYGIGAQLGEGIAASLKGAQPAVPTAPTEEITTLSRAWAGAHAVYLEHVLLLVPFKSEDPVRSGLFWATEAAKARLLVACARMVGDDKLIENAERDVRTADEQVADYAAKTGEQAVVDVALASPSPDVPLPGPAETAAPADRVDTKTSTEDVPAWF